MINMQRYWPLGLSGICLAVALYFSFTNTAYVLEGCPIEVYPEAGFLFIVAPAALIALILAITATLMDARARSRILLLIASGALSALCLALTMVSIWPTGSSCS
ncbi:hypothetical protein [Sphingomonas sp. URHD0057]|uniref:hypothetical protein n=1 Tax=Sphingomonas sp. URHD0057 TaxID=1380389 RepID=UPI00048F4062|nr:hypothetical protein [Sphingomonas sp. URHD0057]